MLNAKPNKNPTTGALVKDVLLICPNIRDAAHSKENTTVNFWYLLKLKTSKNIFYIGNRKTVRFILMLVKFMICPKQTANYLYLVPCLEEDYLVELSTSLAL